MLEDLWSFLSDEMYEIEGHHFVEDQYDIYTGDVNKNDILDGTIYLTSQNGKQIEIKIEFTVWNPDVVYFYIKDQNNTIPLEISSKECKLIKDNTLCIQNNSFEHTFNILVRKKTESVLN